MKGASCLCFSSLNPSHKFTYGRGFEPRSGSYVSQLGRLAWKALERGYKANKNEDYF